MLPSETGSESSAAFLDDGVRIVSTNYDRTVDTANSLLLGLYSPLGTLAIPVTHCGCRTDHGARAAASCIADCLSLDSLPSLPEVEVRDHIC